MKLADNSSCRRFILKYTKY